MLGRKCVRTSLIKLNLKIARARESTSPFLFLLLRNRTASPKALSRIRHTVYVCGEAATRVTPDFIPPGVRRTGRPILFFAGPIPSHKPSFIHSPQFSLDCTVADDAKHLVPLRTRMCLATQSKASIYLPCNVHVPSCKHNVGSQALMHAQQWVVHVPSCMHNGGSQFISTPFECLHANSPSRTCTQQPCWQHQYCFLQCCTSGTPGHT
jgi:hypothetical protein